ncbi:MAG: hypothetical protein K0R34_2878 [Herbinix sp.]|nr:hypothetical protein [Herbinix sp.]
MSRCPKLEYESNTAFGNYNDEYVCTVTNKHMTVDSPQVKYTCKADYGDEYKTCPIYKNS